MEATHVTQRKTDRGETYLTLEEAGWTLDDDKPDNGTLELWRTHLGTWNIRRQGINTLAHPGASTLIY
jgi:hypothetical protein